MLQDKTPKVYVSLHWLLRVVLDSLTFVCNKEKTTQSQSQVSHTDKLS